MAEKKSTISEKFSGKFNDNRMWFSVFEEVHKTIEAVIFSNQELFVKTAKENFSPREWVYLKISLISRHLLLSWKYHIFRSLNNMAGGPELLQIHDMANFELVSMGAISQKDADGEEEDLREWIANV